MSNDSQDKRLKGQAATTLKKLLGSLELEVMDFMWPAGEATVQDVVNAIKRRKSIAYTTVMTVMGHLVDKGLLTRTPEGKRYRYRVTGSKDEFLQETSNNRIRALLDDFGDLAIAGFLGEVSKIDADRLEQLGNLVQEASVENNVSE